MNVLLIIDPQNDFCNHGKENKLGRGALYIDGAEKDMERLASWILDNSSAIDHIIVTLDNHFHNDIAHQNFWVAENGLQPEPFTQITLKDVQEKKWLPQFAYKRTIEYLEKLEKQSDFSHTIWPEHCLIGSVGAAIYKPVFDAIEDWSIDGNFFQPVSKGAYPFSEHFGAFAAQVEFEDVPETSLNQNLLAQLDAFDNIYIAGEARSHCVANTIKQLIDFAPNLLPKVIILEDTMSDVAGFENFAENIYEKAVQLGAKMDSTQTNIED